jgi:hypothetical protein
LRASSIFFLIFILIKDEAKTEKANVIPRHACPEKNSPTQSSIAPSKSAYSPFYDTTYGNYVSKTGEIPNRANQAGSRRAVDSEAPHDAGTRRYFTFGPVLR